MADIDVERKGPSVWPWVIGLLVLAVLIWLLTEMFDTDDEVVTEPASEEPVMVEPALRPEAPSPMIAALPVTEIAGDPVTFEGRSVSGESRVSEVVGARAFWVEDREARMLVVLDEPGALPLEPGQRVRITDARVTDASTVDPQVREAAGGEDVVLSVSASNVEILGHAVREPADTSPARM